MVVEKQTVPEAWVKMPSNEDLPARAAADGSRHPYDFGFYPSMARRIIAHRRIRPAFSPLFPQTTFSPGGTLARVGRAEVASVAAAGAH